MDKVYRFNKIDTKEKAYILGYILSKGIINNNDVNMITSLNDREVIEFISEYINGDIIYAHQLNKSKRIFPYVSSGKRIKDITKFTGGILKKERHFPRIRYDLEKYLIQGLFDGDGCITWGRRKDRNRIWQKVSFTSQLKLLEGVQKYLINKLNITSIIRPKCDSKCFVLEISNREDVIKFCNHIYSDDDFIILKRKYLKYNALRLELEENGESNSIDC